MRPWRWCAADPVIWKPSEKTPLTALAVQKICDRVITRFGSDAPEGLLQVVIGGREAGEQLANSGDVAVLSATGSVGMGRAVGTSVAQRLGRTILELGGNNAMIVAPSADLELALRAIVFSAVGTAGQRCTSLRRLFVHEDIYDGLMQRLTSAYDGLPVGDPLEEGTLVGPLIDMAALQAMEPGDRQSNRRRRYRAWWRPHAGRPFPASSLRPSGDRGDAGADRRSFVRKHSRLYSTCSNTALSTMPWRCTTTCRKGLRPAIFTSDVREAETFLSAVGSDCGIANVNIGPSGAEIGGAFGGEKDTGGGRESGSDAWKGYMRRQTSTVNYSRALPLAQGIKFDI